MGLLHRIDRFLAAAVLKPAGAVFLVGGLIACGFALAEFRLAWQARGWPSAAGEVRSAVVGGRAAPRIEYAYALKGREYTGTTVHVGQYSGIRSSAEALVRRYPAGAAVRVFYDPADPGRAVLEHRLPWTSLILLACGAAFLAVGVLCLRARTGLSDLLLNA